MPAPESDTAKHPFPPLGGQRLFGEVTLEWVAEQPRESLPGAPEPPRKRVEKAARQLCDALATGPDCIRIDENVHGMVLCQDGSARDVLPVGGDGKDKAQSIYPAPSKPYSNDIRWAITRLLENRLVACYRATQRSEERRDHRFDFTGGGGPVVGTLVYVPVYLICSTVTLWELWRESKPLGTHQGALPVESAPRSQMVDLMGMHVDEQGNLWFENDKKDSLSRKKLILKLFQELWDSDRMCAKPEQSAADLWKKLYGDKKSPTKKDHDKLRQVTYQLRKMLSNRIGKYTVTNAKHTGRYRIICTQQHSPDLTRQ